MSNAINTFSITLPVNDELLKLTLFLFCGKPGLNRKKFFTYSIVCRINGMQVNFFNAEITANYGRGAILTDCPVVKNNQFVFSNGCTRPVALRIKANIISVNKAGNTVSALFLVDVKYTLQNFIVSNTQLQHSVKKASSLLPVSHDFSRHSLTAS